jgi:hypothetical protein
MLNFLFLNTTMFHIGRAPKVSKYSRKPIKKKKVAKKEFEINETNETYEILFTTKPKQWLLIPHHTLSFFEKSLLRSDQTTSFIHPYLQSLSFATTYPEDSIGYIVAKRLFPTELSYCETRDQVKNTFIKNIHIRQCMKRIVNAWKLKKMKIVNDVDVVTQELPLKLVKLVDWPTKTIYQFEASTILRDSYNRLMNHDLMILETLSPRNPFTNTDLTYGNCLSIHDQLRKTGKTNWLWEAFANSQFDTTKLLKTFEVPMKLSCIDLILKDSSNMYTIDFVMDYILGEYVYHKIQNPPSEKMITALLVKRWENPTVQSWICICRTFWRAHICNLPNEIIYTHIKSKELIGKFKFAIINIITS